MATFIPSFQADATKPSMLMETELRAALSLNEDFGPGRSLALLKDHPQADKPSGLTGIRAGYGQFFPAQNLVRPSTSLPEAPSWLYLKVSFTF